MIKVNKLISNFNHNKGTIDRIKYIVIHYTGSVGGAESNAKYFANADRGASAHYFVGYSGEIWQSVEDKNIAWHCGSKNYKHKNCRNSNSIGIEMCTKTTGSTRVADKNWFFEDATVDAAVELTKELMKKYGVPKENILRHYDVTGKTCPAPYVFNSGKHTWSEFLQRISEEEDSMAKLNQPSNEKIIWDFLIRVFGNPYGAAGIMGNLKAESNLNPINLQNSFEKKLKTNDEKYTKDVDSGKISKESFIKDGAGYGLAQWTYWTRKKALYEYAKQEDKSIGDLAMQLVFLCSEIIGNAKLAEIIRDAESVKEASDAFLHIFEKPADQSAAVEDKRAGYGIEFFKMYGPEQPELVEPEPVEEKPKEEPKDQSFKVKVDIPNLNIRTGPGINYMVTGKFTGIGVFTIVQEANGWGKLKSGAGWICLKYTKRM